MSSQEAAAFGGFEDEDEVRDEMTESGAQVRTNTLLYILSISVSVQPLNW